MTNLWVILLKDTSYVSIIGLADIVRQTGIAARVSKEAFFFYGIACLLYLTLALISSFGIGFIDRWSKSRRSADEPYPGTHSAASGSACRRQTLQSVARRRHSRHRALADPCRRADLRHDRRLGLGQVRAIRAALHRWPHHHHYPGWHVDHSRRNRLRADCLWSHVRKTGS